MPVYTKVKLRSRDKWPKLNEIVKATEYLTLMQLANSSEAPSVYLIKIKNVRKQIFDEFLHANSDDQFRILWEPSRTLYVWRMLPPHDGAGGILAQAIVEYAHLNFQTLQDVRDCKLASHTGSSPPFHL